MEYHRKEIEALVKAALSEDIGPGDLTTLACIEPNPARARVWAKSPGVVSGLVPFMLTYEIVDSGNRVIPKLQDGDAFSPGDTILEIEGFNLSMLTSERVAMNFLAHLSGVATYTRKFVEKVVGTDCQVLDTRKTTPGYRCLEKMAVRHGGGTNHRNGLYDMILIKDNHIASAGSITAAVESAKAFLDSSDFRLQFDRDAGEIQIEVEVVRPDQVREAIAAGADRLLLDNQPLQSLRVMVGIARKLNPQVKLEASGNVNLSTVGDIAATGVDFVSVGTITHSAPVVDLSMKFESRA
jgi:nicotinate-nucleotide pyrophosphorylase (carboxylating)